MLSVDSCRVHSASEHFFEEVFCDNYDLIKKIAVIAFHILTLGIPLLVHKIIYVVKVLSAHREMVNTFVKTLGETVDSLLSDAKQQAFPFPKEAQEAITFAMEKLKANEFLKPFKFIAGGSTADSTHQPTKQEIALLTRLYFDQYNIYRETFTKNQDVLTAADGLMKIAYTISVLTLADLQSFTKKLDSEKTFAKNLTRQDSYQYRTFYYCTNVFHELRGLSYTYRVPDEHAQPFYTDGTTQHQWRTLYNDYCDRVRKYVPEEELRAADQRHVNWTKKDTGVDTFKTEPDTQPT